MSRTPPEKRLHLFGLGNDRCPICLTGFTEADVREGKTVTLEHVPAKTLNAGGRALCLTCQGCNNTASKVEAVVAEAQREQKVQLEIPGLPIHTARISVDQKGNISSKLSKLRVSEETFSELFGSAAKITLRGAMPTQHYASVPWLKAAYLSVFSLLGPYGYRYAQGEAIEPVRRQIMEPNKEILRPFHFPAPPEWQHEDGVAISRTQRPCWVVKMRDWFVLLPRSWDTSFYEWIVGSAVDGKVELTLGGGPLWYPQRFGDVPADSITFREGADFLRRNDIFGCTGSQHQDGVRVPFVMVDRSAEHVTLLLPPLRDSPDTDDSEPRQDA